MRFELFPSTQEEQFRAALQMFEGKLVHHVNVEIADNLLSSKKRLLYSAYAISTLSRHRFEYRPEPGEWMKELVRDPDAAVSYYPMAGREWYAAVISSPGGCSLLLLRRMDLMGRDGHWWHLDVAEIFIQCIECQKGVRRSRGGGLWVIGVPPDDGILRTDRLEEDALLKKLGGGERYPIHQLLFSFPISENRGELEFVHDAVVPSLVEVQARGSICWFPGGVGWWEQDRAVVCWCCTECCAQSAVRKSTLGK